MQDKSTKVDKAKTWLDVENFYIYKIYDFIDNDLALCYDLFALIN